LEEKRKQEQALHEKTETGALEFPNKRRDMILAAIFALTAMIGYAFCSGLVVIENDDGDFYADDFSSPVEEDDNDGGDED
jgi:metaxin